MLKNKKIKNIIVYVIVHRDINSVPILEVLATDLYNFHADSIIIPHSTEYYLNRHYDM